MRITHVVKTAIPVAFCLLLLPVLVCADSIIYFVDGTYTRGAIRKRGVNDYIITRENGKNDVVPASDIKAIRNGNDIIYLDDASSPENVSVIQVETPAVQKQEEPQGKNNDTVQFADKIYLDDGQVLSGKIVSQNPSIVTIVSESGQAEVIYTRYVKRISKVDNQSIIIPTTPARTEGACKKNNQKGFYYKHTSEKKTGDFVIKSGPNITGQFQIKDGSYYLESEGTSEFSFPDEVDMGFSLSAEYTRFFRENMGLGIGVKYQLPQRLSMFNGKFSFIPIYALAKICTVPDRNNRNFYAIGQVGYGSFTGNDQMKSLFGKLTGGLYTGIGCGYSADTIILELLYATNQGSFKDAGYSSHYDFYTGSNYDLYYERKGKISYSCLSIHFGVKF